MHPLKKFLTENKLTVREFAERIGVTREYLHSIISRKRKPHPETATAIEKATDGEIKKEWLIFPDDYREEIEAYIQENQLTGARK